MEQWLPVRGYEGLYEVSDEGRVRSVDRVVVPVAYRKARAIRGQMMKLSLWGKDYLGVRLSHNGVKKNHHVHRLVLEAFRGPCPEGHESCHRNDVHHDNYLTNLYWGTRSANMHDLVRNGRHHHANKTHCPKGHKYTADNLVLRTKGSRDCRVCHCERERARQQRIRASM